MKFYVLVTESRGGFRFEDMYRSFDTFEAATAWVVSLRGMLAAVATIGMVVPVTGWRRLFRSSKVACVLRANRAGNVWDWEDQWTRPTAR